MPVMAAHVDRTGALTLPASARDALGIPAEGGYVAVALAEDGSVTLLATDPDQAWYWTEEWQAGEREAEADLARGEGEVFESGEAFLAALERERKVDLP